MNNEKINIPAYNVQSFYDASSAVECLKEIYNNSIKNNIDHFKRFVNGDDIQGYPSAFYPYIYVTTNREPSNIDARLSYGFVRGQGTFGTTITRPDLYADYLEEQLSWLLNHNTDKIYIGISNHRIPLHFSFFDEANTLDTHIKKLDQSHAERIPQHFAVPNIKNIDDSIADGVFQTPPQAPLPLSIYNGERIDISLQRLMHYTGTSPDHFQQYILLTNYQFYVDEFISYSLKLMEKNDDNDSEYTAFVQPGNHVTYNQNLNLGNTDNGGEHAKRLPQMPAYHLKRADKSGITLINIGVGPSNAKTITDHVAVLRPHCWIMLGHCAGLRQSQRLGDYVLAHGYLRQDNVLDNELPLWIPVPPLAEIQQAIQQAVAENIGASGYDLKKVMRTGTVATVANRNWEFESFMESPSRFSQARAIAVDMESATIAANGLRHRVPYGTLLCVSDRPLHGELKLPGMADSFYRERVSQHLEIGLRSLEFIRESSTKKLHSRKLRTFQEPAFR